ncbi:hypothetical protein RIF29_21931 [Crotalaria pallida]|uniref:Uncharacterized protein n=1 Tax=Crotalaria pallida TaxID=3830 RepID=A0AAN9I6D5_CROPI
MSFLVSNSIESYTRLIACLDLYFTPSKRKSSKEEAYALTNARLYGFKHGTKRALNPNNISESVDVDGVHLLYKG